jgi:hypothetical protein
MFYMYVVYYALVLPKENDINLSFQFKCQVLLVFPSKRAFFYLIIFQ